MFALNLLIVPILLVLALELWGFIRLVQRYRSGWLAIAVLITIPVANFGLYEGMLLLWQGSSLMSAEKAHFAGRTTDLQHISTGSRQEPREPVRPTPDHQH